MLSSMPFLCIIILPFQVQIWMPGFLPGFGTSGLVCKVGKAGWLLTTGIQGKPVPGLEFFSAKTKCRALGTVTVAGCFNMRIAENSGKRSVFLPE